MSSNYRHFDSHTYFHCFVSFFLDYETTEILIIDQNSNHQGIIEIEIKDEDSEELKNSIQSISQGSSPSFYFMFVFAQYILASPRK